MLTAGNEAPYETSEGISLENLGVDLAIVWSAMIDAAIADI